MPATAVRPVGGMVNWCTTTEGARRRVDLFRGAQAGDPVQLSSGVQDRRRTGPERSEGRPDQRPPRHRVEQVGVDEVAAAREAPPPAGPAQAVNLMPAHSGADSLHQCHDAVLPGGHLFDQGQRVHGYSPWPLRMIDITPCG